MPRSALIRADVLLLSGLAQPEAVEPLVRRVLQVLAEPARMGDPRLRLGVSISVACHPRDASDGDRWFKFADIALYAAKWPAVAASAASMWPWRRR